ncbi:MAG: hypothetical protein WC583_05930 [Candidatus Omnitrophota bacterium]|jgi:Tfp pilus assembly protein PilN
MIEINLLPQELHKENRSPGEGTAFTLSLRLLAAISAAGLLFVFFLNVFFFFAITSKKAQLSVLEQKWEQMLPAMKEFEQKKKVLESFSRDSRTVAALSAARINWSDKLERLAVVVPPGVWFNALTCSDKGIILEASVFSPGEEMELLNRFISGLKEDAVFSAAFFGIELGAVNRETAGGYEIMNFLVNAPLQRTTRK